MNYSILAKFIKDINFKIPDSKSYFLIEKNISSYKINFDIKSKKVKEDILEVDTNLKLISQGSSENEIEVSVVLSTIIKIKNTINNKKDLEKIVLVEVPTSIYPDIRSVLIFLFEKSGFKKINIDKSVDFQNLYQKNN